MPVRPVPFPTPLDVEQSRLRNRAQRRAAAKAVRRPRPEWSITLVTCDGLFLEFLEDVVRDPSGDCSA